MERKDQPNKDGISSQAGLSSLSGGQARSLPSVPRPGEPGSRFNPVVVSREEQAARREKAAGKKSLGIGLPPGGIPAPDRSAGENSAAGPGPHLPRNGSPGGPVSRGLSAENRQTRAVSSAQPEIPGGPKKLPVGPNPVVGPGPRPLAGAAPAVAQGFEAAQAEDAGVVGAAAQGFTGGFMTGMEGLMTPAAAAAKSAVSAAPKGAVRSPEHIAALENIDGVSAEQETENERGMK